MNKIVTGVLGVATTGVLVSAAAYAAFTAQATISGINFTTGSAALEVSPDGTNYSTNFDAGLDITGAFPGFGMDNSQTAPFWLRNNSAGNLTLDVEARLTSAGGWGTGLENYVELAVVPAGTDPSTVDDEEYLTLSEWNFTPHALINDLASGEEAEFDAYVRLREDAPDSVSGKSLTNITFTFTGTQTDVTPSPTPSATPEPTPTPVVTPEPTPEVTPNPNP